MHQSKCQLERCSAEEKEGDATASNICSTVTKYNVDCRMIDLIDGFLFAILGLFL